MPLIDLSHRITDGMMTYPGIPAPHITSHLTFEESAAHYAEGTEFSIGKMTLAANTGTYLDTPAHRHRDGWDLAGLDLGRCADLPVTMIRCRDRQSRAVGMEHAPQTPFRGHAVLVDTGWDEHWGTDAYASGDHPYVSTPLAEFLVAGGASLVGIDSLNIDSTDEGTRPVHTLLLAVGVVIVEHLCRLDEIPDGPARFHAVPPAIEGMATFPVRAFAVV